MNHLSWAEMETLGELCDRWGANSFVLIGASALGYFIDMRWRRTNDLDLLLAVSVDDYASMIGELPEWTRLDPSHRLRSPSGGVVDMIPASMEVLAKGVLEWPDTERKMSLLGLRLAFEHAVRIELPTGHVIQVAPVHVLALLKMIAFLDRPEARARDLADLAHIMEALVPAAAHERFDDEIIDLGLRFEDVSPYVLGRRVASVSNDQERRGALEFVDRLLDEKTPAGLEIMRRDGPPSWRGEGQTELRLHALRRGLESGV